MDKRDIYEHLAKIYLDASSQKKKKSKAHLPFFRKPPFIISVSSAAAIILLVIAFNYRGKSLNSEIALVLQPDAVKINFHFDPAKKEIYSLDLNELDLTRYKQLGFAVKKVNSTEVIALRVEFMNEYKEKSEIYFKDIPRKWQDYTIDLAKFKHISDWSNMARLSFAIEEWNVGEKKGIVYIDNIKVVK